MNNGHWSPSLVVTSVLTDCFYVHSDSRCCGVSWREALMNTHYGLRKSDHMLMLHYCDVSLIPRIPSSLNPQKYSWDWWMSIMGAEGWVGCFCLSVTRVICATCQRDMTQSILGDSPKSIPASLITGRIRDRQTLKQKHNSNNCLMSPCILAMLKTDVLLLSEQWHIHETWQTEKAQF